MTESSVVEQPSCVGHLWIDSLCVSESIMMEKSCAGMGHNMHILGHNMHISNWNQILPVL